MRRFVRSTRGRLTLIAASVLSVALITADGSLYLGLTLSLRSQALAHLQQDTRSVAASIALVSGHVLFEGGPLPTESPNGDTFDLAVVGSDGPVTATPGQPLGKQTLIDLARPVIRTGQPLSADLYDVHGVRRRTYAYPLRLEGAAQYVLVSSQPVGGAEAVAAGTVLGLVLLSAVILLLGTILVYWLVGRVLSPVRRIAALADTLSEKELHRRIEVPVPDDEMGALVDTFNRMLGRLEASFDALRRFTADASHELRAPLTLMEAEVETSLLHEREPEEYRRVLGTLNAELLDMKDLVERLLLLARADAGELRADMVPMDVADLLHECRSRWSDFARTQRVDLDVDAPDSGRLLADPSLVGRILDNLLDNALRHSRPGSTVRLSAQRRGPAWEIAVVDSGPGIPASERSRIFQRFARLDVARTRSDSAGAGLGLSLSAEFAALMRGRLELLDTEAGSTFQLALPAAATEGGAFQPAFSDGHHDAQP